MFGQLRNFEANLAANEAVAPLPFGPAPGFATDEFEVMVTRLDVEPDEVRVLATLLSEPERERANRFVFDRDRRRFIVARARLRQFLSTRLATPPESVGLIYGKHGKPALAAPYADSGVRFNVTHSAEIAAYAFSTRREIGIDVEAVRTIPDADAIAARFFSPRENEAYLALNLRDRAQGFFNCWTRKEAFIKAIGDGLYYPLGCFEVALAPDEPARILRVQGVHGDDCGWRMEGFSPASGFVAAVVVESLPAQAKPRPA